MSRPAAPEIVEASLDVRAFEEGFAVGASGKRGRQQVDERHAHWKAGYEEGRKAALTARLEYWNRLKRERAGEAA